MALRDHLFANAVSCGYILGTLVSALAPCIAFSQKSPNHAEAAATFDVASVKPCRDNTRSDSTTSATTLSLRCATLEELAWHAWLAGGGTQTFDDRTGLQSNKMPFTHVKRPVEAKQPWIRSERFTVTAKTGVPAKAEQMRGPMLQQLLVERFSIRVHMEARDHPVYFLQRTGAPVSLEPFREGDCIKQDSSMGTLPPRGSREGQPRVICGGFAVNDKRGGVDAHGVSMARFGWNLSNWVDRDIVDATGIAGLHTVHLDLSFADLFRSRGTVKPVAGADVTAAAASEPGGTVPNALRKVGLRLQRGKVQAQILVIDEAHRPTEN